MKSGTREGRALAQADGRRVLDLDTRFVSRVVHVRFVVDKVALG